MMPVYHKVPGGLMADPGGNGVIKRTSTNVTAQALADDMSAPVYAVGSGTNTITATLAPAISGYVAGAQYRVKAQNANTAAVLVNLCALGNIPLKKVQGGIATDLVANDIRAGQMLDMVYDGTNLQLTSQLGNALFAAGNAMLKVIGGVPSLAVLNGDYMDHVAGSGLVKVAGGVPALAVLNTDYMDHVAGSGLVMVAAGVPALLTNPIWTVVSSFLNSWTDSAAGRRATSYAKNAVGDLLMTGDITPGTQSNGALVAVCLLPVGFRPATTQAAMATGFAGGPGPLTIYPVPVYVLSNGTVFISSSVGITLVGVLLDFRIPLY